MNLLESKCSGDTWNSRHEHSTFQDDIHIRSYNFGKDIVNHSMKLYQVQNYGATRYKLRIEQNKKILTRKKKGFRVWYNEKRAPTKLLIWKSPWFLYIYWASTFDTCHCFVSYYCRCNERFSKKKVATTNEKFEQKTDKRKIINGRMQSMDELFACTFTASMLLLLMMNKQQWIWSENGMRTDDNRHDNINVNYYYHSIRMILSLVLDRIQLQLDFFFFSLSHSISHNCLSSNSISCWFDEQNLSKIRIQCRC